MMDWSFDMSRAPKGAWVERITGKNKAGEDIIRRVYVSEKIIVAGNDGELVTLSNWLPDQERWNMFTKEVPPIAWAYWPDHPGLLP